MATTLGTKKPQKSEMARFRSAEKRRGGRLIQWVDGRPVPVYAPALGKEQVTDLFTAAMSCEYTGEVDVETGEIVNFDERFTGMTNAEVMAFRLVEKAANGNLLAVNQVYDRILGKPKQSHESIGVQMTYKDFLDRLDETGKSSEAPVYDPLFDFDLTEDDDDLSDLFGE
jgi:hypothetical protein